MGLKNWVPVFKRVVEYCLRTVEDVSSSYVDDIIVGEEFQGSEEATVDQHNKDVRRVLDALKEHKLLADSRKYEFFIKEVEFCW